MNIKYLNTIEKHDLSVIRNCEYLRYWINDRVIEELNVTDNDKYIEIISMFNVEWNRIIGTLNNSKYKCEATSGPLVSLSLKDFKFRKDMYDYYYNYVNIKERKSSNINACSEACKYLTSIYKKYETFKSECSPRNINKCVSKFDNFGDYDPNHLINELKCKSQSECNRNEELVLAKNSEGTPMADVNIQDETDESITQVSMENSHRMIILNIALPVSVFFLLFPMLYKVNKFVI
ncbi:hypothetical protein PCYB_006800 [Plasmodium cynomolgi strain B]|uniref:CYIR protein n=1 Tax=Plasmodium cynomolgi (strain B) TaxID=1120755 RepID=K6UFD9_PLACD|nr:hypothetical protein PCYB_006800 [Plasmodium cynomolgi strain B]GAB69931.1 hypothetical protein PCYB_006800 [Plasmodium cynomolgi strain B]